MKARAVFAGGIGGVIALVVACSSDPDPAPVNNAGSCAILASQCHPYDGKSQIGTECHELGHAGDDTRCGPRLKECQANCPETDSGGLPFHIVDGAVVNPPNTESDASPDAPVVTTPDAGPDECATYCACFQEACKARYDSIYATGSCVETCKTFAAEDRTCFSAACQKAKNLAVENRQHECEHASGAIDCH